MEAKTELQRNAVAEARRKELETYQRALDIQWLNSRMSDGGMGRSLALIQKEAEMEKEFQERTDHAAIVDAQAKKEIDLGIEVAKARREEACELLRRHYLRERDPSLRELIKKLQAGYVRRDLQQQILHNEYRRLQEKAEENRSNSILLNSLYNDQHAKEREEKLKMDKESQYCAAIQQQLVNKERQKQCDYEETMLEKRVNEDVMQAIADEDQRELCHKHEQTDKMRVEMVTSQKARVDLKEKQKAMNVVEDRKIEEQVQFATDRSLARDADREHKVHIRDENEEKMANKMMAAVACRQERDDVITQHQDQEFMEKNIQGDIDERTYHDRMQSDTKEGLLTQMQEKKDSVIEEKLREADFRKTVDSMLAEEDELEREKQRKKKEKNMQYSADLQQQIHDNAVRRKKDKEDEAARCRHEAEYDQGWRQEVSEERKKIMEDHVPKLLGYVQPGVITQVDIANPRLADLGKDLMSTSKRPKRFPKCNAQCRILREY
ncbi:meiosis-specific nuclear structural protein 1-like isoform X1 [Nymphalis io]|uniref:meiosis-specific nuclear structural protein 1-like isoform X1 n=1 Tax=Inachis io TaxID=171585 RepID=UPI00216A4085|nr:meiosis-specific nuclear structural protein 1-like isoform X1 [Nymphalis io]